MQVRHSQEAALVGLQHGVELRGENDGFVNVNSLYLTVIVKDQDSVSERKAQSLWIVFQMV